MARILRTFGQGFGVTDAAVTVKFNDQIVFSGTIPTKSQRSDLWQHLPDGEVLLFEFGIPGDTVGNHVVQYEMLSGIAIFSSMSNNFAPIPNPVWSSQEHDLWTSSSISNDQIIDLINSKLAAPLAQEQIDSILNDDVEYNALSVLLADHDLSITIRSADQFEAISQDDPRTAVTIDGISVIPTRRADQPGTWHYTLQAPQIMQFNLNIPDTST